jgi:hypothetical protein
MYRRSDAADMQARQERSFGGLFLFRYIPSFGATIPLAVFIVPQREWKRVAENWQCFQFPGAMMPASSPLLPQLDSLL